MAKFGTTNKVAMGKRATAYKPPKMQGNPIMRAVAATQKPTNGTIQGGYPSDLPKAKGSQ